MVQYDYSIFSIITVKKSYPKLSKVIQNVIQSYPFSELHMIANFRKISVKIKSNFPENFFLKFHRVVQKLPLSLWVKFILFCYPFYSFFGLW